MTKKISLEQTLEDLALMMLYLTRFSDTPGLEPRRAWKNYDWATMDRLKERAMIDVANYANKSVMLTDEGLEKAQDLLRQYKIEDCV